MDKAQLTQLLCARALIENPSQAYRLGGTSCQKITAGFVKKQVWSIIQYGIGKENGAKYDNRYDVTVLVNKKVLKELEKRQERPMSQKTFKAIVIQWAKEKTVKVSDLHISATLEHCSISAASLSISNAIRNRRL